MIIHKDSHTDHAINSDQWKHILEQFKDRSSFFIETIELPEHLGHVMNGLYGPSCGDKPVPEDEVYYAKRGDRAWKSRMTAMPARPTRFVRVIAGPHEVKCTTCEGEGQVMDACGTCSPCTFYNSGALCSNRSLATCPLCRGTKVLKFDCILYTAYGVANKDMPAAPKEPGDIRKQMEELHDKRAGLHDMSPEYQTLQAQIVALRDKRAEADAFWAEHALATEKP